MKSKLCLTLTGSTLKKDLEILEAQKKYIDMAELRLDFLEKGETAFLKDFYEKAGVPVILTLRRICDGGKCDSSEDERALFFEKLFASFEAEKYHFDFVDFEEDFRYEKLEKTVRNSGTRIIRSVHDFKNPVSDIEGKIKSLGCQDNDIPKIAFMPLHLSDVTNLFEKAKNIKQEHILLAMGPYGIPSRILAAKLGNYLTFTSVPEKESLKGLGHLDPETMCRVYRFKELTEKSEVYGITGFPLEVTSSPELHNSGYTKNKMDAVYVPVKSETIEETLAFNEAAGIKGMSVTIPHKEHVMKYLSEKSQEVQFIGACNTIVKKDDGWHGFNTDAPGFSKALLEACGSSDLKGRKVSVIGAGGAACAVIYAVHQLGAECCIFNRTVEKAKILAEKYGFSYAALDESAASKIHEFSDIIIQTTSKGMSASAPDGLPSTKENDPVWFYDFKGTELIFDIIYHPEVTPVMARARKAGCKAFNGFRMLQCQGYEQFRLFTGKDY